MHLRRPVKQVSRTNHDTSQSLNHQDPQAKSERNAQLRKFEIPANRKARTKLCTETERTQLVTVNKTLLSRYRYYFVSGMISLFRLAVDRMLASKKKRLLYIYVPFNERNKMREMCGGACAR